MSSKEIRYYDIVNEVLSNKLNASEAAKLLDLTTRHIRRLKAKVKEKGMSGLVHRARGKLGNRSIPQQEKQEIIKLLYEKYPDFKPGFAAEKLAEDHHINRDSKTIRTIMISENLWKPKRKKKEEHRSWRQRRPSYGELIQYDGSYEYWFEDRGGRCCLLASVDDATSEVSARFDEHEGVFPTFSYWEGYLRAHGKPLAIYVDRFSTYSMNQKQAKENEDTLTQFQRAMAELNIEVITAHSSQAKGRVERLFETLQDRLIKELRLKNISTVEQANRFLVEEFLPKFNARFMVRAETKANLHRKLNKKEQLQLASIFSRQYKRVVRNDFTISYKKNWYQLGQPQPITVCKHEVVIVEESRNTSIKLRLRGKYLNFTKLPDKPKKLNAKSPWILPKTSIYKPPQSHPWRKFQFSNKLTQMSK